MIEDDEVLQMYIEESLEHLSDIESDLLTIEGEGEEIDIDIVNNVFRAAHSIKGGAGFMGLTTIKGLAHSLENVLDLIRNRELQPTPNRISVLLNGFDKLESLMQSIQTSNDEDVSEIIDALAHITKSSLEDEKESVDQWIDITLEDGRLFPGVSQYSIDQVIDEGKYIYLVEYDLIRDIHRNNKNPIEMLNSLEKTGTIVDSRIDFDAAGTLDTDVLSGRIPFQILFASILEPDMASTLFDLPDEYIHLVTDEMIGIPSGPNPSGGHQKVLPPKEIITPENYSAHSNHAVPPAPSTAVTAGKENPERSGDQHITPPSPHPSPLIIPRQWKR